MSPDRHAVAPEFLAGLAEGLGAVGFWEGPAVVAVSGGADSVALLQGIVELARLRPSAPTVTVAHGVHDLRPTAGRDAAFVSALAERLGLRCRSAAIAVRAVPRDGAGTEGLARRLRYRFLLDVAREEGAVAVAVAHTASDQAETILHRIVRGTGVAGLAGMPPRRRLGDGVELIRPLLGLPGAFPRAFLLARGMPWVEDETNTDLRYSRNFLRHAILPHLESGPYPAASAALVRLGRQAAAAAAALRRIAQGLLAAHAVKRPDGSIVLDVPALAAQDPWLVAEMLAVLWEREAWPRRHMAERHYTAVVDAIRRGTPSAVDLPGGIRAERDADGRLTLGRQPCPDGPACAAR